MAPAALVQRAHAAGVGVLALTDHDTMAGLGEAAQAAAAHGLHLVPGVEVSVSWNSHTIHVVGLNTDPAHEALCAGLDGLREFRDWRAEEIGLRLAKAGVPGAYEGARGYAKGRIVGRTHFAHFLVERGHASNLREVFKRFLVNGKPGYVSGRWSALEQAVAWIRGAGGQAVIAHPARYGLTATKLRRLIGEFMELGGEGIEVVTGSHSADQCQAMAGYARRHGLSASVGSDYHGPENPWIELGRLPSLPGGCKPIWESAAWTGPALSAATG